ncbi:MAG: hypothetical protein GY870_03265 [archaeon]|nr:hypothetical protein [archaeon]
MRLIAKINDCLQYCEDGWETIFHCLEITEKTTIQEIIDWQKKKFPKDREVQENKIVKQIHISDFE